MHTLKWAFAFILSLIAMTAHAINNPPEWNNAVRELFNNYYQQYKDLEYFSGASLSIYVPKQPIQNYYVGKGSHNPGSANISADTLFEIGSITKSFTAATLIQLETTGSFNLNDTVGHWLPQYRKWTNVTISSLLNMTSGLPNYSDSPLMNAEEYKNRARVWSNTELIAYAYPPGPFVPPLKPGYFYSNTGYLLAGMIAEKVSKRPFRDLLMADTIQRVKLSNTFYPGPSLSQKVSARLAHGYNYNQYDNPSWVGQDMYQNNLTWAGAAGAIISNSEDIIHWIHALFIEDRILNTSQKKLLMQLISTNTGKPIQQTTATEPHGFGLGIVQAYDPDLKLRYWFYQGETLGFRAVYMYIPCNGIIISAIFNSATNEENNHIGLLMKPVYQAILQNMPALSCRQ